MKKFNNKLDEVIKENSDKLKFTGKGITSRLPRTSWLDNYKNGGDISLSNVYPNQMVPKFEEGGSLDCPCPDQPDCKCPEVTYTHNPGTKGIYRLQRTVTPYTSNRDIRRYTQAPTDPRQVNFIQNYAGAIGYQDDPSFVYPTQVPMEGEKHWNIDKFLIDPQFSRKYGRLENAETTKEQARANALADMYKYYMLQYPNKKGKAFRQAKRFVRREIDPRISGPFYDYYLNKDLPIGGIGGIESFADANRLEQLYQVNPVPAQADMDRLKDVSIDYFRNYKKMSKKEAENYWKEWERGAAQFPAGDPAFYNNSTEMSEPLVPLKYGGGAGPYPKFPSTGMLTSVGAGPKVPTMKKGGQTNWTDKYKF